MGIVGNIIDAQLDHTTIPLPASGAGSTGTSRKASPADHWHAMQGSRLATVALLGDSITANNFASSDVYAYPGSAHTETSYAAAYFTFAQMILGWPFKTVINAGVAGQTSAQILARVAALIGANPGLGWCCVMAGTNDALQGIAPATTIANLQAIYRALAVAGVQVLALTIPPNGAGGYTSAKSGAVHAINAAIVAYAKANPGIVCANTAAAVADPVTGEWASGYSTDYTHPLFPASYAMGRVVAASLRPYVQTMDDHLASSVDAGNILANGQMYGDGNTLASDSITAAPGNALCAAYLRGWRARRLTAGTTATVQAVARTDGQQGKRAKLAITAAGAGDGIDLFQIINLPPTAWSSAFHALGDHRLIDGHTHVITDSSNLNPSASSPTGAANVGGRIVENGTTTWQRIEDYAAGDTIQLSFDFEADGFTTAFPLFYAKLYFNDAANSESYTPFISPYAYPATLMTSGNIKTRPIVIPADATTVYAVAGVVIGGADSGNVYFSRAELRKV